MPNEVKYPPIPPEGVTTETVSQVTTPLPQESEKPQEAVQPQVERKEDQPTSEKEGERPQKPKPSDFYGVRELKKQMNELAQLVKDKFSAQPPTQPSVPFTIDDRQFWEMGPAKAMEFLENKILERLSSDIPSAISERVNQALEKNKIVQTWQEVDRKIQDYTKRDPSFNDRLDQIGKDFGLEELAGSSPDGIVKVSKAALAVYEKLYGNGQQRQQTPLAPTKGQMQSVVSGQPASKAKPSPEDGIAMMRRLSENPTLAKDEEFMKQYDLMRDSFAQT